MRVVRNVEGQDRVEFRIDDSLEPDRLLAGLQDKYPDHELSFVEDPFEPQSRAIRIAQPGVAKGTVPEAKPEPPGTGPAGPESQARESAMPPKAGAPEAEPDTRACPYCGETIRAVAIKCKHCGSDLAPNASPEATPSSPGRVPPEARRSPDLGLFLLGVPSLAVVLIWVWVGNMNLLQSPEMALTGIGIGTLLITAVLATVEAAGAGMKRNRQEGTYGPTAWFFLILLLWVVCYPAYLFKRRHYGFANLLVPGLIIGAVYLGSWMMMDVAIVEARAGLQDPFQ